MTILQYINANHISQKHLYCITIAIMENVTVLVVSWLTILNSSVILLDPIISGYESS